MRKVKQLPPATRPYSIAACSRRKLYSDQVLQQICAIFTRSISSLHGHSGCELLCSFVAYCANTPERCRVAIQTQKKIATLSKSKHVLHGMIGGLHARLGERDQAIEMARQLEDASTEPRLVYLMGMIRCALGEDEAAIEWLEKAEEMKLGILTILSCEPIFARLRPLPRFQAVLRRLGLPQ